MSSLSAEEKTSNNAVKYRKSSVLAGFGFVTVGVCKLASLDSFCTEGKYQEQVLGPRLQPATLLRRLDLHASHVHGWLAQAETPLGKLLAQIKQGSEYLRSPKRL